MLRNLPRKIFALFLSFLFWIFVVSTENVFSTLPYEIPIQPLKVSDQLALATTLPTVKVTVRAESPDLFRQLQPLDFEASIDVSDLGAGEHEAGISVISKHPDVRIVRVEPEETLFTLEPIREKITPISVEIQGSPKAGYKVLETRTSHAFLRIKGAESILNEVAGLKAVIKLDGKETDSFQKKAELFVKDAEENEIINVEIEKQDVLVDVTINQVKLQKQIPVKVVTTANLVSGSLTKIVATPASVLVEGDKEIVSQLTVLETEPINLSEISGDIKRKVKLRLPEGVILLDATDGEVEVTVEVE